MRQRVCDLLYAVGRAFEREHLVDDIDVGEEICDGAGVRLAFHMIEEEDRPAVEMLLQAGDLEIGVDLDVGGQHIALRLQELQRLAQRGHVARRAAGCLFFFNQCGHRVISWYSFVSVSSQFVSTSSLSWPRRGAGRRTRPGVSLN